MDSNVMCKEYCNDGVNSNINCGLGVIVTHQCIIRNYNKGITHREHTGSLSSPLLEGNSGDSEVAGWPKDMHPGRGRTEIWAHI